MPPLPQQPSADRPKSRRRNGPRQAGPQAVTAAADRLARRAVRHGHTARWRRRSLQRTADQVLERWVAATGQRTDGRRLRSASVVAGYNCIWFSRGPIQALRAYDEFSTRSKYGDIMSRRGIRLRSKEFNVRMAKKRFL